MTSRSNLRGRNVPALEPTTPPPFTTRDSLTPSKHLHSESLLSVFLQKGGPLPPLGSGPVCLSRGPAGLGAPRKRDARGHFYLCSSVQGLPFLNLLLPLLLPVPLHTILTDGCLGARGAGLNTDERLLRRKVAVCCGVFCGLSA